MRINIPLSHELKKERNIILEMAENDNDIKQNNEVNDNIHG